MLEQTSDVKQLPPSSLEEMRQKRLAYFSSTQHNETLKPANDNNPLQLLASERGTESEVPLKLEVKTQANSSNDQNISQMKVNLLAAEEIHNNGRLPSRATEILKSTEKPFIKSDPIEQISRPKQKESVIIASQIDSANESDFGVLGLTTHRPKFQEGDFETSIDRDQWKYLQGIFSDRTREEIRSALGEQGLRDIMVNIAKDLRQLHKGRTTSQDGAGLNKSEADFVSEFRIQDGKSSLVSSAYSGDMRCMPSPKQSFSRIIQNESQSSSKITSTITRNIQQLKEGENEMNMSARNYNQVTVHKKTNNTFSADEIYRQAFGVYSQHQSGHYSEHQSGPYSQHQSGHYSQHQSGHYSEHQTGHYSEHQTGHYSEHSGPWTRNWQDRQEHSSPLDGQSDHPRSSFLVENGASIAQNISPCISNNNMFSYPPPMYLHHSPPVFESNFNNRIALSPHLPGSRTSSNMPPGETHLFASHWSESLNNQQPSQHYQDLGHTYYKPPSTSLQPAHGPYRYSSSPYSETFGVPVFTHRIPLHLPPPPIPQYSHKNGCTIQSELQPHPPSESRKDGVSQFKVSKPQVAPDPTGDYDQYIRVLHPSAVRSALSRRDESHDTSHARSVNYDNSYVGSQCQNEDPESFNLHRYFSSLEMCNRNIPDPSGELSVSSSQSMEDDVPESRVTAGSTFTEFSVAATTIAGGVTQRLNDLDIDLDQLKHLRVVDEKGDRADFEVLSKAIRYCPECRSSNKAYMDWCMECGELLIGIEAKFPKKKTNKQAILPKEKYNKHGSSKDIRSVTKSEKPIKLRNFLGGNRMSVGEGHSVEDAESLDDRYHCDNSPESGRGLSAECSPVDHCHLEKNSPRELLDSGQGSTNTTREEEIKLGQQKDNSVNNKGDDGRDIEHDDNKMYDDVEMNILEEVQDPVLREFIISYKRRQLLQQAKTQDERVDIDFKRIVRKANSASHSTNQDFMLENFLEPGAASQHPLPVPRAIVSSLSTNKNMEREQKKTIETMVKASTEQKMDSKSRDVAPDVIKTKKKKKKWRGEAMDIEVFGYDETRESRSETENRVSVPTLNLACSSDEEEDDEEEEVEEEAADNNNNEIAVGYASGSNPAAIRPTESQTYFKHPSDEDNTRASIRQTPQQHPKKTTHTSPPRPCFNKSEAPLYRNHKSNVRGPVNHKRHWARSSIAWSSYNPRELSTRRSVNESHKRPSSATVLSSNESPHPPANGLPKSVQNRRSAPPGGRKVAPVVEKFRPDSVEVPGLEEISSLPAVTAADASFQSKKTDGRDFGSDSDSPRLLCAKFHRLPKKDVGDPYADRLHAVAKSAYYKLKEMTPRIVEGQLSLWQCLPDEIWLYIFNFLSHCDLKNVMLTSRYLNRLANDETLWKCITVRPRCALTDISLAAIAHHQPLSLAMVKCQGHNLSLDGLTYFFKETQGRLQELNICGCSQGSLVGSVIMSVAAQYCQQLTHLDASFCHLTDKAFIAMSECAERLESVCVNGFQSLSDSSLMVLLKKHGQSLRILELYACFSLSTSAFHSIGEHCGRSLRRLCLGSCNKLTDSAMISLSVYLGHIEELDLRGCKNLKNDCIRKIVRNCPRIHTLVLANCHQISDIALTEIATYLKTTLHFLDVCGCSRISDDGVASLANNCDHLTTLDISSTRCSSASVQQLADSSCNQQLETVKLSFLSGLNEACLLSLIHQCPRLRSVHVFGCSSLKNLAKLQSANANLSVEGDSDVSRSSLS